MTDDRDLKPGDRVLVRTVIGVDWPNGSDPPTLQIVYPSDESVPGPNVILLPDANTVRGWLREDAVNLLANRRMPTVTDAVELGALWAIKRLLGDG